MDAIACPIDIAIMAGQGARSGLVDILFFTGFLSLSLGVMNLFQFPCLDGGIIPVLLLFRVEINPPVLGY